jgi:hypothetical protein
LITRDDLIGYMGITTPVPTDLQTVLDLAVGAANELVVNQCIPLPATWPQVITDAALLQAARLVKRRASPEGVAGMGDFGPVRVSVMDPDIENDLAFWRKLTFA